METALHAARLVLAQAALLALLDEAQDGCAPNQRPDGVAVRLDQFGTEIEFTRDGMPIAGEAL